MVRYYGQAGNWYCSSTNYVFFRTYSSNYNFVSGQSTRDKYLFTDKD